MTMGNDWRYSCGLGLATFSLAALAAGAPAKEPIFVLLHLSDNVVYAEVPLTNADAQRGLSKRTSLDADAGMLFSYKGDTPRCLWMKDTTLPLSVAFINEEGRIIDIFEMKPKTTNLHCAFNAKWALEMNTGWFAARGIRPKAQVLGLDQAESLLRNQ